MKFSHGDVTFEVQDGWVDASSLAFMEPPDASLADEFAKQAAAAGAPVNLEMPAQPKTRANFQLNFRPWMLDEMDPKEFIGKELPAMMSQIPGNRGELEWVQVGDVEAAFMDVEVQMEGMSAKQLHAMTVMADRVVHFCGTTNLGDYDKYRQGFLNVLSTLRFGE